MRLKRSSFLLIIMVLFLFNSLFSQSFNRPESAVYDAANDRYLISNTGDGNVGSGDIISVPRTDQNNLSYFYSGAQCASLRGITIVDNVLWGAGTSSAASTNQYLYGFDLNTGNIIKSILLASGLFINDVTAGLGETIYVSDDNTNQIFAVNTNTGGYSSLNFDGANGLLFDEANNRLLYTDDTNLTYSQISAIDLATNTSSILIENPNFQWLDGLTVDHLGNYYVSCWSNPYAIYRYDSNFTGSIIASNHANNGGAAEIFYDTVNNVMVVPNMDANTVQFIPFADFANLSADDEDISTPTKINLYQNFPNPFNPSTTIFYDVSRESNVKVTVFDLLGREVIKLVDRVEPIGSKSINWDGRDYTGNLVNAGVYIYHIEVDAFIQTKKMVLLK